MYGNSISQSLHAAKKAASEDEISKIFYHKSERSYNKTTNMTRRLFIFCHVEAFHLRRKIRQSQSFVIDEARTLGVIYVWVTYQYCKERLVRKMDGDHPRSCRLCLKIHAGTRPPIRLALGTVKK
jgi:hypothetical protein